MVESQQMNIVVVGHVDHGKSTVVGRLLADTHSLPEGKLQSIQESCKNNSKEFEYAFLLDALRDERDQGITIDTARCFFKSKKREYIIIDAPGHIEFLKNMISGAARAEAALLVIDADEGIQENSRRHAYMLSLLGITQLAVLVNKMDVIKYDKKVFTHIQEQFSEFLKGISLSAKTFIPISARHGEGLTTSSSHMPWYTGASVLEMLDSFVKEPAAENMPFRMPVQGIYKFTGGGDSRRIVAGRVESGTAHVGEKIIFLPSGKSSTIASIEEFTNAEKQSINAGESTGFTLSEQVFINRGELACSVKSMSSVGTKFKASVFWMGKEPLIINKQYKLKIGTQEVGMKILTISSVLNSSNLQSEKKSQVDRHEVGEVLIETANPIAYDLYAHLKSSGRFVMVDNYDICGGGIIAEKMEDEHEHLRQQVYLRQTSWDKSSVGIRERSIRFGQIPKVLLITGPTSVDKKSLAKEIEHSLFQQGHAPYFLGIGNLLRGLDADISKKDREEHIRRFGEVAHILLDAGLIVIATASDLSDAEVTLLKTIIDPSSVIIARIDNGGVQADIKLSSKDAHSSDKILALLYDQKVVFGGK